MIWPLTLPYYSMESTKLIPIHYRYRFTDSLHYDYSANFYVRIICISMETNGENWATKKGADQEMKSRWIKDYLSDKNNSFIRLANQNNFTGR